MCRQIDKSLITKEPFRPKQDLHRKEPPSNLGTLTRHIISYRNKDKGSKNLIGEFQRPPEVAEQQRVEVNNKPNSILNQQWDDQLHLQPPLRPTTITSPQVMNTVNRAASSNGTVDISAETTETQRRVEVSRNEDQRPQGGTEVCSAGSTQPTVTEPLTNRRIEHTSCTHCSCHGQLPKEKTTNVVPTTGSQRPNLHTEYEDKNNGASKFFQGKKQYEDKGVRECQIIRILPEEDDYMEIVRNGVSAQNRKDLKPMFVNNFFAGDNNWRTEAHNAGTGRHSDESRSRMSTGVPDSRFLLGRRGQEFEHSTGGPCQSEVHGRKRNRM